MTQGKTRPRGHNPSLKRATCAALIAATFAVPVTADSVESIERYCTSSWRQAGIPTHDWEDCTQDTLLELLSRVDQQHLPTAIEQPESPERRELMRSVWCVAQRWRRHAQRNPTSLDVVGDNLATRNETRDSPGDSEAVAAAMQNLNSTQQQILKLFVDGHSIREISEQLDIPPARVSDQKYKAVQCLKKTMKTNDSVA